MAHLNAHPVIAVQGGVTAAPTLLGQSPARIPTGGKIRAGIKVLTKKAAGEPRAKVIYDQGVAAGQSFEQIERAITDALPNLKTPLVPRNVPWFTVRGQDFPNPEIAREILEAHGEAVVEMVRAWYENYGFFGVLVAAVTPIPYKVFTIASGMMSFDLAQFVLASVLGRGMRFFLVAGLIRLYGARIKPFMERHFELAASALVVLAILGFMAIKYLK